MARLPPTGRTRREALAVATGCLAALAGCSGPADDAAGGVRVAAIEVENRDDAAHDVDLRVTREDGRRAFAETASLAAGDATVYDAPVDGAGAYTLVATLDEARVDASLAEYASDGQDCVRPVVRVTNAGTLKLTARPYDEC